MEDHVGIQGVVGLPRALYRKKKNSIFQSILAEHSSIFHGLSNGTCPGNKLPRVTKIYDRGNRKTMNRKKKVIEIMGFF